MHPSALPNLNQAIITTSADAYKLAVEEAKPFITAHTPLSDTAFLVSFAQFFEEVTAAWQNQPPIFVHHICPAQVHLNLQDDLSDLAHMQAACMALTADAQRLIATLPTSDFSVQTRILDRHAQRLYQPFEINQQLAQVFTQLGYALNVQHPKWVVSIVIAGASAYLGVSTVRQNLSDWAGGQRRFRRDDEQISRAEFKLLEALEVFGLVLPTNGKAADLGAAPGGWTRLLRQHGLEVWAIDPGELHPSLQRDPKVHHIRGYAQQFDVVNSSQSAPSALRASSQLDVIVNDMRLDITESAHITRQFAKHLRPNGLAIMTMKLPPKHIRSAINTGLKILGEAYEVLNVRQLFHNRHEVTVALRKR